MSQPLARSVAALIVYSLAATAPSRAQDTIPYRLPPVVTVTRDVGRSTLELPFAITSTQPDSARPGQPHTMLDQTLFLVPGVTVGNRNNPSQDPRISIRGFGARSAFGVRSIRVLRDGMPLTLPDGQTPVDFLDLESVGRVETIRGTASALYGNASGGVIDVRSAVPPIDAFSIQSRTWIGSDKLQRFVGAFGGTLGNGYYQGNVGQTTADNYRRYARQRLTNGFLRAGVTAGGTELAVQALGLDMPLAENPGALTKAQFEADPRRADSLSRVRRARKEVQQIQIGVSARRPFVRSGSEAGELQAQVYGGTRGLYNPLTFAVVDVDRTLFGAGARATVPFQLGISHRLSIGVDAQRQDDDRRNWAACNGITATTAACPSPGSEKGILQLNQREIVSGYGPYLRDEVRLGGRVRVSAGVRADYVTFEVRDAFLSDNRDDSGDRTLHAVSPLGGIVVRVGPVAALYANIASAFETPTTTELGNQPNGNAGLNRDLKPQYSRTYEGGVKGVVSRVQYDAAVFTTDVRDELISFEVPGVAGRTYFRNAGRTRRQGAELEASMDLSGIELTASYTYSRFRFREFIVGTAQYGGNAIPGIPVHQAQGSATWRHSNAFATIEAMAKSKVYVNDANSASAASFSVMNARIGGVAMLGRPWLSPVLGVQNLFDEKYVGSVAVNAAGPSIAASKFYEPAPGRTWIVGFTIAAGH